MIWLAYLIPAALCLAGYGGRIHRRLREDRRARSNPYHQPITWGVIAGYALLSLLPVVNVFALLLHLPLELNDRLTAWIERVLDRPVVRGKETAP